MTNKINEIYEDSYGNLNISVTGNDNTHSNIKSLLEDLGYLEDWVEPIEDGDDETFKYTFNNLLNGIITNLVTEFDWLYKSLTEDEMYQYGLNNYWMWS